jgi:hypothetical protein
LSEGELAKLTDDLLPFLQSAMALPLQQVQGLGHLRQATTRRAVVVARTNLTCKPGGQQQLLAQPPQLHRRQVAVAAVQQEQDTASFAQPPQLVGEDAAAFDVSSQKSSSWTLFFGLLTGVLGALYLVGLCDVSFAASGDPPALGTIGWHCSLGSWHWSNQCISCGVEQGCIITAHARWLTDLPVSELQVWIQPGFGLADDYLAAVEGWTNNNPEATIVALLGIFAVYHSGLAGLRPYGALTRAQAAVSHRHRHTV